MKTQRYPKFSVNNGKPIKPNNHQNEKWAPEND